MELKTIYIESGKSVKLSPEECFKLLLRHKAIIKTRPPKVLYKGGYPIPTIRKFLRPQPQVSKFQIAVYDRMFVFNRILSQFYTDLESISYSHCLFKNSQGNKDDIVFNMCKDWWGLHKLKMTKSNYIYNKIQYIIIKINSSERLDGMVMFDVDSLQGKQLKKTESCLLVSNCGKHSRYGKSTAVNKRKIKDDLYRQLKATR